MNFHIDIGIIRYAHVFSIKCLLQAFSSFKSSYEILFCPKKVWPRMSPGQDASSLRYCRATKATKQTGLVKGSVRMLRPYCHEKWLEVACRRPGTLQTNLHLPDNSSPLFAGPKRKLRVKMCDWGVPRCRPNRPDQFSTFLSFQSSLILEPEDGSFATSLLALSCTSANATC